MAASEPTQSVPLPQVTAALHLPKRARHSGTTGATLRLPTDPTAGIDGARPILRVLSARETARAKETVRRGVAKAHEVEAALLAAFHVDVARCGAAVIGVPSLGYDPGADRLTIAARVYPPDIAATIEAYTELDTHRLTPPSGIDLPDEAPPARPHRVPAPKAPLPRWITWAQLGAAVATFALLAAAMTRWGEPLRAVPHPLWFAAFATYLLGPAVALRRRVTRPQRGARAHRKA